MPTPEEARLRQMLSNQQSQINRLQNAPVVSGGGGDTGPFAESDVTNLISDLAGKVPVSRTIATSAPLEGGGALSGNLSLTVDNATSGAVGVIQLGGDLAGVGGTAASPALSAVISAGSVGSATSVPGITYDGKGRITSTTAYTITPAGIGAVPATRDINTTSPLGGGGALSSDLTLTVAKATASAPGVVQGDGSTVTITAGVIAVTNPGTALAFTAPSITTSSLAANATDSTQRLTTGKAGIFGQITTNTDCWVTIYASSADQSLDSSRTRGTAVTPGTGVVGEWCLAANDVLDIPFAGYVNLDAPQVGTLPVTVKNLSGGTTTITVTATKLIAFA